VKTIYVFSNKELICRLNDGNVEIIDLESGRHINQLNKQNNIIDLINDKK
jgi:hypothetical protein